MSDKKTNVLDKTLKDVYDEITYKDQIGQKTTVKRQSFGGEASLSHNENLRRVGIELQLGSPMLKHLEFLGSAAVHYYRAEKTGAIAFVSQTGSLQGVHELIAADGLTDLRNAMLELYGHKMQARRSGF